MSYPLITAYPMARMVRVGLISLSHNPVLAEWKHSAAFFIPESGAFLRFGFHKLKSLLFFTFRFPLRIGRGIFLG